MPEIFVDPQKILQRIEIKPDFIVAEFGAGSGSFAIPLARKLKGGRLYAFDIQSEVLSVLKTKAEAEGLVNIETRVCNLEEPEATRLAEESVDLVAIPNVLFQIEKKEQVLKEAVRILKKNGRILIIDWLPKIPFGPRGERVDPLFLKNIAKNLKLELESEFAAGNYHFGMIFLKNE
jgi:ubiquinone/menaquinone biosynthesis C-methylase UbiE